MTHAPAHRTARPRSPMRRASTARTGLAVALTMGVISAGVITYFVVSSPRRTGAEHATGEPPPPTPRPDSKGAARGGIAVGAGKGLSVQVASRSDPTRLAGTITSRTLDPLEANRYSADRPESFIFLRDGRTIVVRADSGRLYIPRSSEQPESGTLSGHVEIMLFERRAGGVDPQRDRPSLRLDTDEFAFDLTAWEFFMPGEVRITGPTLSYVGSELRLLVNQPQERVELLRIARTRELRLRPGGGGASAPGPLAAATPPGTAEPGPAAPASAQPPSAPNSGEAAPGNTGPGRAPVATFYRASFVDDVRVAQTGRTIDAGRLELWARLVGGQLAPGAIAPVGGRGASSAAARQSPPQAAAPSTSSSSSPEAPASSAAPAAAKPDTPDEDLVVTCTGPFEMRPLDGRPAELSRDEIALRFSPGSPGPVRFADSAEATALTGEADQIDYGATSRTLRLSAGREDGVRIALSRSGLVRCTDLTVDLASGGAEIAGPGSVAGVVGTGFTEVPGPLNEGIEDRVVRWADSAGFRFASSERGIEGALRSAVMRGDVQATDRASRLRGQTIAADFFERQGRTGPVLRLVVTGDAAADDGRGGAIWCDTLDVAFQRRDDRPEESDPRFITASGSAMGLRAGESIAAERIEATLERDAQGRLEVAAASATGGAVYERPDGVWASGGQIRASATSRTASVSGDGASVGKGGATVLGTQIDLDGAARAAAVFGAGSFEHHGPDAQGRPLEATASWARSMTFDDRTGVLQARGDVHATTRPDEWTLRELEGAAVRLDLSPNPDAPAVSASGGGAPATGEARRVLRAEVVGASVDELSGGRAWVSSRTYETADAPEGRRLAEELRVEGDRIIADDERQTVEVPGPGVLRVVDVRAAPPGEAPAPAGTPAEVTSRGAARFEWDGSLRLERENGTVTMRQRVRMRHAALDRPDITELESEEVVAHLTDLTSNGSGGGVRGRLVRASAAGAVWARAGQKELTADALEYLTTERLIRAAALGDNEVVLFDPARPTPLKAKLLEWDLARDRVDVKNPGTIVIPK